MRELEEETGITENDIELDADFCFEHQYPVSDRNDPDRICNKTLRIFLGWLKRDVPINPTEHPGYEWFSWQPPHKIQSATIDPLLAEVAGHLRGRA